MQAISGVHFNYSFPEQFWPVLADLCESHDAGQDFRSEAYFALLRNYRRHGWIVLYLFGNSPAICPSFLRRPRAWTGCSRSARAACTHRTPRRCA